MAIRRRHGNDGVQFVESNFAVCCWNVYHWIEQCQKKTPEDCLLRPVWFDGSGVAAPACLFSNPGHSPCYILLLSR